MMSSGMLLFYCPGRPAWLGKLRGVLTPRGIRLRPVAEGELGLPVGRLAGLPGYEEAGAVPAEPVDEPVLVLCRLPGRQLDLTLQLLRRAGVPRTVLKAVLTESNAPWSFRALYEELCRERLALAGDPEAHPLREPPGEEVPR